MATVRPAEERDIDSLVNLLLALFSIEEDFSFDEARQRAGLTMMLDNERGCLLVAEDDGRIVGMCSGQITVSTAEGGPALLVEDVVVHADWQRKGIGRQLMDSIGAWASARGIGRLQLLADRGNKPALDFYDRLGWQPTALICLRRRID